MKITKKHLQKLIKEEVSKLLKENASRELSNKAQEAANKGGWDQRQLTGMLGVLASYVADLQDATDHMVGPAATKTGQVDE